MLMCLLDQGVWSSRKREIDTARARSAVPVDGVMSGNFRAENASGK